MSEDKKQPVMGSTVRGGMSNRDWWPNQLNLKILHQHSHLGNPMGAAVARVALARLGSPEVPLKVERQAHDLRKGLAAIDAELGLFEQVRGRGLMLGAVLAEPWKGRAGEMLDHAAAHGLLLLQAGPDVLRFVPPLVLTDEDVAEGLQRLRAALADFLAATGAAA